MRAPRTRIAMLRLPASSRRTGVTPKAPEGGPGGSNNGRVGVFILAGIVLILVLLAVFGAFKGSSKHRPTNPAATAHAAKQANPPRPLTIPGLEGVEGISATALLVPISGATVRLTVRGSSQYAYYTELVTPPTKHEGLMSAIEGSSEVAHKLTIQHLLGYEYLRVYGLRPGARIYKPMLQIPTAMLAETVIAKPSG
jgi:hypothetical protein